MAASDLPDSERRLYTHNQLLGAASTFAKPAEGDGVFTRAMACALFCALSLEAALNYIGASVVPIWDDHLQRKLTPEGKLALLASLAKFDVNFGKRPFQAFRALFELRNQLAHGETKDFSYQTAKHWLEYGDHRWPAAQWEVLCTAEQATCFVEDTEAMISTLHTITGVEAIPAFLISEHVRHARQESGA